MSKESRSGSLTSDLSVKGIAPVGNADGQLIRALVKRILSKVFHWGGILGRYTNCFSYRLEPILLRIGRNRMMC